LSAMIFAVCSTVSDMDKFLKGDESPAPPNGDATVFVNWMT